jgi:hypothetical protein
MMAAEANTHEEAHTFAAPIDTVVAIAPKVLERVVGGKVETLGDGYLVARQAAGRGGTRELTLRLHRAGADTSALVRVSTNAEGWVTFLTILFAIATFGLGLLLLVPFLMRANREEARKRELLAHGVARAVEEAIAAPPTSYRVAPLEAALDGAEETPASSSREQAAK